MTWRGGVLVALLLALGLVGGYAASATWSARTATTGEPAAPIPATPSYPADPEPSAKPDPDEPPLPTDLDYRYERLGVEGFEVEVPVPRGWSRNIIEAIEMKWKQAGYPANTYVLRVERVAGENLSIPAMLAQRVVRLPEDRNITHLKITERSRTVGPGVDTLGYTYLFDGYRRYAFVTWVDVSGSGDAEIEVAVNGRERDVPGLRALVEHVAEGLRPPGTTTPG